MSFALAFAMATKRNFPAAFAASAAVSESLDFLALSTAAAAGAAPLGFPPPTSLSLLSILLPATQGGAAAPWPGPAARRVWWPFFVTRLWKELRLQQTLLS